MVLVCNRCIRFLWYWFAIDVQGSLGTFMVLVYKFLLYIYNYGLSLVNFSSIMNKRVNYIYKYGLYEYGLSLVDFSLIIYESKSELIKYC